jgi:hypothetical protein
LIPLRVAELFTSAKSFEANPIIGNRRLNQWGLHVARVKAAYRLANARRRNLSRLVSAEDRAAFQRDGFIERPEFLPAADFKALLAQVRAYRGTAHEIRQGDTLNRKIPVDPRLITAVPALRHMLESAAWRGLIRYVGARDGDPLVFLQSIFRRAGDGPDDPQTMLHADTFHPAVKAWLFLTDVSEDAGPFLYVPGSHWLTAERLRWERRMSLEACESANKETREGSFRIAARDLPKLNLPQPRAFAVPANTLVVADTFGFHARGPSARPSVRVEVWALGRRRPFMPWAWFDPWSSARLGQRAAMFWKLGYLLESLGVNKSASRRCDGLSAFDDA